MYDDDFDTEQGGYYNDSNTPYDAYDDAYLEEPGASSPTAQQYRQPHTQGYQEADEYYDDEYLDQHQTAYFVPDQAYETAYSMPNNAQYGHQEQYYQAPAGNRPRQPQMQMQTQRSAPSSSQHRIQNQPQPQQRQAPPAPRNATGFRLVPVSTLPDVYRAIFKFGVFNAIQSQCYDTAVNSSENMVISAPTGSGKTVLFELAIIRLLMNSSKDAKCVYLAPTKALCTERFNDWTKKFQHLDIKCCELTGDTVGTSRKAWNDAKDASVIVTTPEKWDSLTRNWREHQHILGQMQLFLVDEAGSNEVHILNEPRGSTLEVCISRMKTRGTSVRFILLSATAPNIEDIASWVGSVNGGPAAVFKFGEEYRPCKIVRHVYSYPSKNQNAFQFSRTLDFKLTELLQRHACGKPVLVFCPTRKGVSSTAEHLAKDYKKLLDAKQTLPWAIPTRVDRNFQDPQLKVLLELGLGVHHAGLSMDDRRLTEELYLSGHIRALVATSTLAVGVNLPAHTVVMKGTQMWSGSGWIEYCDLDVMQMLGRAGRPQFDKEGIAIIMCSTDKEQHYRDLTSGTTVLESCLHQNLTEHLNSEVGLGTITSLDTAKSWLHNSFLFQRLQKNPSHYSLGKEQNQTWQERLDDLVSDSVKSLCASDLVKASKDASGKENKLAATEYGEIMSRYYIRYSTMGMIMQIPEKASLRDIIETLAQADEFNDIRLRASDKQVYNTMREHNDIRMSMKKKIETPADKIMVLIQAVLGGISLNAREYKTGDSQPALEALGVFKHASRIARAIADTAIVKRNASQVKHGLELLRSLAAKAWDDRPIALRQIPQIGEKSIKVLASSGIGTIARLRQQEPHRLELLLNRKPPFGHLLLAEAAALPLYRIQVTEESVVHTSGRDPVAVTLGIEVSLAEPLGQAKGKKAFGGPGSACILTLTSDMDFIDFRRLPVKALQEPRSFTVVARLEKPSQVITVIISSENHAGLTVTADYKPSLPPAMYPTPNTRPKTELEAEEELLRGDDPAFWTITEEDILDITGVQQPHQEAPVPEQTQPKPAEPARLSNGNYACSHACKDKQKCRHVCCKEGALKPSVTKTPKPTKVPATDQATPSSSKKTQTPRRGSAKSTPVTIKKKSSAVDAAMKQLDKLQQSTNVSLTMPAGRRISLAAGSQTSAPTKGKSARPPPWITDPKAFQPTFAVLEDPDVDEIQDDDDLPDIQDALQPLKKQGPSEDTDYSDASMDALMAQYDFGAEDTVPSKRAPSPQPQPRMAKKAKATTTKTEENQTPRKPVGKPLFLQSSSSTTSKRVQSPRKAQPLQEHIEIEDAEEFQMTNDPDASFQFDPEQFEMQDDPPAGSAANSQYFFGSPIHSQTPKKANRFHQDQTPRPQRVPQAPPQIQAPAPPQEVDPLASFLDWVYNSGDVEIVDE